ncbi:MAG: DUF433 domain-containing protein [Coleofasciculus chthonoplastes F3-SA18-01]|uniref:DUF433 domain-containing protein n=1 Tax=Coleofasciculus chthonoplastes TaxID=64178 RepID=UPI0032F3FFD7
MTSYSLNFPNELKQQAENLASQQGIPLEAFILDAIAEKVNSLTGQRNAPTFAQVTYRNSASGQLIPILRGTNLRVKTVVIAAQQWGLSSNQIAAEYDLNAEQIDEAIAFYHAHREEIDHAIAAEQAIEAAHV